ncbi:aminotransferase class IV family protein [Sulfurimonas sp.]
MNKQYLETIKVLDGEVYHLEYHQERMTRALNGKKSYELSSLINAPKKGLYRCRIVYDALTISVEYHPYIKRDISSLKLIESNDIEYNHKYLNRREIDNLFLQKKHCDDILIVKDSLITDTSIANIAFYNGEYWITPKKPLLRGTTRERLLQKRKIFEADISIYELKRYEKIALMNAMIDFDIIAKENIEEIIC